MGLDMYLEARRYVSKYNGEDFEISSTIKSAFPWMDDDTSVTYVTAELGYWRKANSIHKWFVDNVQEGKDECQTSTVELSTLLDLRQVVLEVLSTRDPDQAHQLLPTQSGFFFGTTDYDESYFDDLIKTLDIIARCEKLNERDEYNWDFYYRASW